MSNIFSTRTYTLPDGTVIDVPRGITIGLRKQRYVYAALRVDGKVVRFEAIKDKAISVITRAVKTLIASLKAGNLPGGYHTHKRTGTQSDDLPPGLTLRFVSSTQEYRLYISYPDVAVEKLKHTNFYVGTPDTYLSNYDAVILRGKIFRNKHLKEYKKEFLRRLKELLNQLTSGRTTSELCPISLSSTHHHAAPAEF